ncbi:MAG: aldehyde dehydrogenase [Frankia sp.]|nr:aldehyde dehydrogenase [Frankia sp.]
MREFPHLYVGGSFVPPATDERLTIHSPADGTLVGRAPAASAADVDRAGAAARAAFDEGPWPRLDVAERARLLGGVRDALAARLADLDELGTRENGIPISVRPAASALAVADHYLAAAGRYPFEQDRRGDFGSRGRLVREPVGVVAGIVPWNGPLLQAMGKLIPALVAGCTAVLKPAEETPLTSLALAECFAAAGLPEGTVSILPGGRDVGRHLVAHPGVDKVAFTGSTAAGREIARICGEQLKRVTLELGGKSAAVVLDDADAATTATLVALGCMVYSGQACAALTRALVPAHRHDELVEALCAAVRALPVGDPLDEKTVIGPLVAERQLRRVEDYIASGLADGARLAMGGRRLADRPDGWFVEPTVFVDVDNSMRIAQEEIFGPVLCVIPYRDEDEAVRLANDTSYGLSGAVFSGDDARADRVARRLRTGSVGVNALAGDVGLPFGGYKCSGIGREFSIETLDEFTELKTLARTDTASFGLVGTS